MDNLDNLNRFEKEEFLKHLKITWTYNSNAIEGNSLNYSETQFANYHRYNTKARVY